MKFRFVLMSILMLLPLPAKADEVYFAKVSVDLATDVPNLKGMDQIIKANTYDIAHFFGNGDLSLKDNEVMIMRGGKGDVKAELDKYKGRSILLVRADGRAYGGGPDYLDIRGCYVKRTFSGTLYIAISASNSNWYKFCPELSFRYRSSSSSMPVPNRDQSVQLADIANALLEAASIKESEVKTKN